MIADRIKALREARGWTQAELARRSYAQRYQFVGAGPFDAFSCVLGRFSEVVFRLDRLPARCGTAGNGQCHRAG